MVLYKASTPPHISSYKSNECNDSYMALDMASYSKSCDRFLYKDGYISIPAYREMYKADVSGYPYRYYTSQGMDDHTPGEQGMDSCTLLVVCCIYGFGCVHMA